MQVTHTFDIFCMYLSGTVCSIYCVREQYTPFFNFYFILCIYVESKASWFVQINRSLMRKTQIHGLHSTVSSLHKSISTYIYIFLFFCLMP